jgi:hypothetical protein
MTNQQPQPAPEQEQQVDPHEAFMRRAAELRQRAQELHDLHARRGREQHRSLLGDLPIERDPS